ncbi:hypothetical protein CEXT_119301 [Caerostris extrusa]|uniref:LAGLIDADG homing endonuclease n=1 Tax=Caerostris extrusa TaxID=172846 RepID=A0AAV4XNW8_CAEEX|nr:hypothetical protein CEXT_119301 [Caerostris extrusa]
METPGYNLPKRHLKNFTADADQHREITTYLKTTNMEYFCNYSEKSSTSESRTKGLPISYTEDEIAEALKVLVRFKIDKVIQLSNLKIKARIPVWQLTYLRCEENEKIFDINRLLYLTVRVEI